MECTATYSTDMTNVLDGVPPFEAWPKMARLKGMGMIVTEKIDGTNAQVLVLDDGRVVAGSRTRYVTPDADNFGFARWVEQHADELRGLGPGRHFGEWWGVGIQRGYDLWERRFSLFNTERWLRPDAVLPACCSVVPRLYAGVFNPNVVETLMQNLVQYGSSAVPGFMQPEGVCVYVPQARVCFKRTVVEGHKGQPDA